MIEELFDNLYCRIGLGYIYLFLLYELSDLAMPISNLLGIPYDLKMSSGMEFGATLSFILVTLLFYSLCVALYVLAHAIASTLS